MLLEFVPLLASQRALQRIPRGPSRFQAYLRMMTEARGSADPVVPLSLINPMAREHVTTLLDALIDLDADGAASEAVAEAAASYADTAGVYKIGMVVIDDAKGGWTNRAATDFWLRFHSGAMQKFGWLCGALWSGEPPSVEAARQAVGVSIHRAAYLAEHGPARTLRDRMAQEGFAMAMVGCAGPTIDPDDLAYSRQVIEPFLGESDFRSTVECLFGDAAARSLGLSPRGLSDGAGLALALHDARVKIRGMSPR